MLLNLYICFWKKKKYTKMLIANPIYDTVFKFLLEDKDVAKRLISNIIDEHILEMEVQPQEQTTYSNLFLLTVYRVDFKAIIKTKEGQIKKVLIELQKGKNPFDIMRFRHYLGDNYSKMEEINGEKTALPIITIYFLGFKLSIEKSILKINRIYTDLSNGETIFARDEFIEKLSHDSYIIQIPFLPKATKSHLEEILSVFSQRWVFDKEKRWVMNFSSEIEDEDLKIIAERLAYAVKDVELQQKIRAEEDIDYSIEQVLRENEKKLVQVEQKIEENKKTIEENKKMIEENKKMIEEKEKTIEEKEKTIEDKEKTIEDKEKTIEELLRQLANLKK